MKNFFLISIVTVSFFISTCCILNATTIIVDTGNSTATLNSFSYNVDDTNRVIDIYEDWSTVGTLFLTFSDFPISSNAYTVNKHITNNTAVAWTSLANELLDPSGDQNDLDRDPTPQPAYVPARYSTSNDYDGLHFDQYGSIPRTSDIFNSLIVDELTDARDFLDFYNGIWGIGNLGLISYGLEDQSGNQPFLLAQRPNEFSKNPIPEPATMLLLGFGLLGIAGLSRKK